MAVEANRQHASRSLNASRFVSMPPINFIFIVNFMNDFIGVNFVKIFALRKYTLLKARTLISPIAFYYLKIRTTRTRLLHVSADDSYFEGSTIKFYFI
jgi:hypothetical protein